MDLTRLASRVGLTGVNWCSAGRLGRFIPALMLARIASANGRGDLCALMIFFRPIRLLLGPPPSSALCSPPFPASSPLPIKHEMTKRLKEFSLKIASPLLPPRLPCALWSGPNGPEENHQCSWCTCSFPKRIPLLRFGKGSASQLSGSQSDFITKHNNVKRGI